MRYPDVRIGDFFYPVGACRWSIFRGLMTAEDIAAVTKALQASSPTANISRQIQGTFTIQSEGGDSAGSVTTQLFMLPPIPIYGASGTPTLYLVNLVDERYFWHQWFNPEDCTGSVLESWSAYLNQLATQLNITLSFATPADVYGIPEIDSPLCTDGYDNPAALLDLVAANVGCAVVRNLDGTYKLQRFADANNTAKSNLPASGNNLLGGPAFTDPIDTSLPPSYFVMLPGTVRVVFPLWTDDDGSINTGVAFATDTLTIGYGAKNVTIGPNFDYVLGSRVRIDDGAGNLMEGAATAYDSGTGVLTVAVDAIAGSGTISSWTVYQTGFRTGYDSVERGSYTEREYYRDSYPTTNPIDVAVSSLGEPYSNYPTFTDPATKVIRTTYKARFNQYATGVITNLTDCTNLANQLAKDYLDARLSWIDEAVAGIYPWPPEGVSDLLYCWRNGQAFTRALAPPFNAGPTDFQHGLPVGGLPFVNEQQIRVSDGIANTVYQNINTLGFTNLDVACDPVHGFATMTTHQRQRLVHQRRRQDDFGRQRPDRCHQRTMSA